MEDTGLGVREFIPTVQQRKILDAVQNLERRRRTNPEHLPLFVVASAGTGKTTTILEVGKRLLHGADRLPGQRMPRICHLAFNRATMKDATEKYKHAGVDSYIDTRTVNSWACSLMSRIKYSHLPYLPSAYVTKKFNAPGEMETSWQDLATYLGIRIETGMPDGAAKTRAGHKAFYAWKTVLNYCHSKKENIETSHIARLRKKNPPKSMLHLCEISDQEWVRWAKALYDASANLSEKRVSFTQDTMMKETQLYLKRNSGLIPPFWLKDYKTVFQDFSRVIPPPDYIMVDESQDMDECSFDIIRMAACRGKSVLLWIGDYRQSIYQFKGANNVLGRAVEDERARNANLPESERKEHVFYLTVSHRFGPVIADEVDGKLNKGVMEPLEKADYETRMSYSRGGPIPPYVSQPRLVGGASFPGIIHNSKSPQLQRPYTVLCRSNKGVINEAMQVLDLLTLLRGPLPPNSQTESNSASQTPVQATVDVNNIGNLKLYVLGKQSLRTLVEMVEKILQLAISGTKLKYRKVDYTSFDHLVQVAEDEEDTAMQYYCEFVKALRAVEGLDIPSIMRKLRECEVKEECEADVVLGTIHQAKGLEWPRVQMGNDIADFIGPRDDGEGDEASQIMPASCMSCDDCDGEGEEVPLVLKKLPAGERNCVFVMMTRPTRELRTCEKYDRFAEWLSTQPPGSNTMHENSNDAGDPDYMRFSQEDEEACRSIDLDRYVSSVRQETRGQMEVHSVPQHSVVSSALQEGRLEIEVRDEREEDHAEREYEAMLCSMPLDSYISNIQQEVPREMEVRSIPTYSHVNIAQQNRPLEIAVHDESADEAMLWGINLDSFVSRIPPQVVRSDRETVRGEGEAVRGAREAVRGESKAVRGDRTEEHNSGTTTPEDRNRRAHIDMPSAPDTSQKKRMSYDMIEGSPYAKSVRLSAEPVELDSNVWETFAYK